MMAQYPQDPFADVLFFHEKFCPELIGTTPKTPPLSTQVLRLRLMQEEMHEIEDAIANDDLSGVADGLADLIYVAFGCAITYGIDLRPVWNEVHTCNMKKVGGSKREDGKVLKPEGWKAPDIAGILEKQGKLSY